MASIVNHHVIQGGRDEKKLKYEKRRGKERSGKRTE